MASMKAKMAYLKAKAEENIEAAKMKAKPAKISGENVERRSSRKQA